ncbi:MAG TPA: ABC transporter ATP-binding protein, partial [Candidatus Ozemobacteraceae bacterium]|nr:ABC transporter ATP-binding protein [Candidatus Ozemobacteraceae bacterium]
MFRNSLVLCQARRLSLYLRPFAGRLLLAAATMLLVTGLHLLRPLILRELIDRALPQGNTTLALHLGLAFVGALAVGALALYGRAVLLAQVGTGCVARLKADLLERLLSREMAFFHRHAPGKLISRVENDIEQMRGLVSGASAQCLANVLLLVAISSLMIWQEPKLVGWLALAFLGGGSAVFLYARHVRDLYREVRERDSELSARLTEFLQGVSLLRLYGREEAAVQRISDATRHRCEIERRAGFYDTVLFYGGFTLIAEIGSLAVLLWYGSTEVFAGRMTVGTLVMFLELMRRFFGPLRELAEVLIQMQSGLAATGRVLTLLEQVGETTSSEVSAVEAPVRGGPGLERVPAALVLALDPGGLLPDCCWVAGISDTTMPRVDPVSHWQEGGEKGLEALPGTGFHEV